jgi:hypothetical protein
MERNIEVVSSAAYQWVSNWCTMFHEMILIVVLPHVTTEDTIYDGHFTPKGSIIQANIKYQVSSPIPT